MAALDLLPLVRPPQPHQCHGKLHFPNPYWTAVLVFAAGLHPLKKRSPLSMQLKPLSLWACRHSMACSQRHSFVGRSPPHAPPWDSSQTLAFRSAYASITAPPDCSPNPREPLRIVSINCGERSSERSSPSCLPCLNTATQTSPAFRRLVLCMRPSPFTICSTMCGLGLQPPVVVWPF